MRNVPRLLLSKRAHARVVSTLICAILIVVHPFSRFAGVSAFLVLTVKELVFSSQYDLAQQLENTTLNLAGACTGIGIAALAQYLARLAPQKTVHSRAVPALFLVASSFLAGYTKSRLPRLQLAARISLLILVFILTTDVEVPGIIWTNTRSFLWICITAAVVSLFSSILLLKWTSTKFAEEAADTFSKLHSSLESILQNAFSGDKPAVSTVKLEALLLRKTVALASIYSQAAFELRVGRVNVKAIKPFIGIAEHLRRELAWGTSISWASHPSPTIQEPSLALGRALLSAMVIVQNAVLASFVLPAKDADESTIEDAKSEVLKCQTAVQRALRQIYDELDVEPPELEDYNIAADRRKLTDVCLFVVSLLQMSREMEHALSIAHHIVHQHNGSPSRLWTPHFSKAWLGLAPSTFILEERESYISSHEDAAVPTDLSEEERQEGLAERNTAYNGQSVFRLLVPPTPGVPRFTMQWAAGVVYKAWNRGSILEARLSLSRAIRSIRHSQHVKYAVRLAVGVALLSIPAFLPSGHAGRRWFTQARGQWMIISFTWVLDTTSGATLRVGYLRLTGTILGAIYAYVAWLVSHNNPYALVFLVTLAELPISWVIINTTFPSLGVVASITLPPILFTQYVQQTDSESVLMIAVFRGLMIGAGILAALLLNGVLFPRHARVLFLNQSSLTLGYLNKLYMAAGRDLFLYDEKKQTKPYEKHATLKLELQTRNTLQSMSLLLATMADEVSLQPKPIEHYRRVIAKLQRFLDLEIGLRKVRENIPRETVTHVYKERRAFVSCVCISLFACQQAFDARHPLPQFLPSGRKALGPLEANVRRQIKLARENGPDSMSPESLVYSFAEGEVLKDLVDVLEELVVSSRQLFGTSKWLEGSDDSERGTEEWFM